MREELAALPPPPTDNQTFIVHNLIREFDTLLGGHLTGGPGHNEFQQELRSTAEQFRGALKTVRPALKFFQTFGEEEQFAAQLGSPRKIGASGRANKRAGDGDEWFGDRDRETSPSLRKARKGQQGVEVHTLSSDEGGGAGPQSKRRRHANELVTASTPKKSKRVVNSMIGPENDGMFSSVGFAVGCVF